MNRSPRPVRLYLFLPEVQRHLTDLLRQSGEQADQNWQQCKAPVADWWRAAAILAPLLFTKGGH
jgi:hypothetical protein